MIEVGRSSTIRSYSPDILKNIYIKEKKDGTGDILISHQNPRDRTMDKETTGLGFLQVRNPRDIEAKLKRLAE